MEGREPPTTSIAGSLDGRPVKRFLLENSRGMAVTILEYGGIVETIRVPDAEGGVDNVALGLASLDEYVADGSYFGSIVGRFANRLEKGRFRLDGQEYQVTINDPPSSVHGGSSGFNRKVWDGTPFVTSTTTGVRLRYVSPAGEEGFPGQLDVTVLYELLHEWNTLRITYSATTDAPTIVNLTNHSFINLDGEGIGSIVDHIVEMQAERYLPLSESMIPIGETASVVSTPLDFRSSRRIGTNLQSAHPQIRLVGGYDHNFVLTHWGPGLARALTLSSLRSGRSLQVWTTEPALDFYTGNYFDGSVVGARGVPYEKWAGIAIEPEHASNSPNMPSFPSTVLRPGETYGSSTEYRFSVLPRQLLDCQAPTT